MAANIYTLNDVMYVNDIPVDADWSDYHMADMLEETTPPSSNHDRLCQCGSGDTVMQCLGLIGEGWTYCG